MEAKIVNKENYKTKDNNLVSKEKDSLARNNIYNETNIKDKFFNSLFENRPIHSTKNKNANKMKNIIYKKYLITINYFIILMIALKINIIFCGKSITIKIEKSGLHKIFFVGKRNEQSNECIETSKIMPDLTIEVNGMMDLDEVYNGEYYLEQTNNSISLTFCETKNDYQCLFYGCSNITEIDLSNFDVTI